MSAVVIILEKIILLILLISSRHGDAIPKPRKRGLSPRVFIFCADDVSWIRPTI